MSESAKILLAECGEEDRSAMLCLLAKIREWDNGSNYPIIVENPNGLTKYDSIDNIENVIKENRILDYWMYEVKPTSNIDSLLPPIRAEWTEPVKVIPIGSNFTPKKKKRK